MGQITIVGCNKGGATKTTTCIQMAVKMAHLGLDFIVVNADKQKSLPDFIQYRNEEKIEPRIPMVEARGDIAMALFDMAKKYQHVLVDVAGRNSEELVTGMLVADQVIAPHQSSQFDMDTMKELSAQARAARLHNKRLRVRCYQSMASTHPHLSKREREDFVSFIKELPELEYLAAVACYRQVYRDSAAQGKGVLEANDDKARAEVEALYAEVFGDA